MEKKIQKLLDNKYENLVQFNVANTTSNPIFVDLFNTSDLSVIPNTPTYLFPPNSVVGTFGSAFYTDGRVSNNGFNYYIIGATNQVAVFDTNFNLFTTIIAPTTINNIAYSIIDDNIFLVDVPANLIYVVDCSTNTIISTIITPVGVSNNAYNLSNNYIYFSGFTFGIYIFDCTTLSFIASVPLNAPFSTYFFLAYNPNNNLLYITGNGSNDLIALLDVISLTYLPNIILPLGFGGSSLTLNESTNTLYLGLNVNDSIGIVNTLTNVFISSINFVLGTNPSFGCVDTLNNQLYFACQNGNLIQIDGNTNNVVSNTNIAVLLAYAIFNPITNSVLINDFISSSIIQYTTIGITSNSYYITGSANYNSFVNNLNNEPIKIQMIRLLVLNQDQLYNQVQLTTIDSNGNQIFLPDFPINKIDINQEQGNISEIELKDVVFDGRTYLNQYKINPYETISFEVYYTQLDLTSATPTYPIFFKPKIQLKEYIKKELNL